MSFNECERMAAQMKAHKSELSKSVRDHFNEIKQNMSIHRDRLKEEIDKLFFDMIKQVDIQVAHYEERISNDEKTTSLDDKDTGNFYILKKMSHLRYFFLK